MVTVEVLPKSALVDEVVEIVVSNLRPSQKVTVVANIDEGKNKFGSYAHFEANDAGRVDVNQRPSLGGSYTGT